MDAAMIERRSPIHPELDLKYWGGIGLPVRSGRDVALELHGRLFVRYLVPAQAGRFRNGSTDECYVTPTPYTPEEAVSWLLLPAARVPRDLALLLNPEDIPEVIGPVWVARGRGIQYILPGGFPESAILVPGTTGHWEVTVA